MALKLLDYEPTNTSITLKGKDIEPIMSYDVPVYLLVDGKLRICECVMHSDGIITIIGGGVVAKWVTSFMLFWAILYLY